MTLPRNTILHGDCTSLLPGLPTASVDFVLTDPPYGVRYTARDGRSVPNDDNLHWLKPAFAEIHRLLKPDSFCVSFYGWPQADRSLTAFRGAGFRVAGHFVFPKCYASGKFYVRYQHECAYLLIKGKPPKPAEPVPDVIPWRYSGNKLHPTQKPVSALLPLIDGFTAPGDLVLDPFAGSGSCLLAARNSGRDWLGIELDAKFHAAACKRLAEPLPDVIAA